MKKQKFPEHASKIAAPEVILQEDDGHTRYSNPARLPDGKLIRFRKNSQNILVSFVSGDAGHTWKMLKDECKIAPTTLTVKPLVDNDGELHIISLVGRGSGRIIAIDLFIDVWHQRTTNQRTKWEKPTMLYKGFCGALMDFKQLSNGRLVVPFAYWVPNRPDAPPVGANVIIIYYSDDGGYTWVKSDSELTTPCYDGFNGINYGATEPAILELKDDRLWMLMRTQTGFLYESYSSDKGATWLDARPSRFHCSTSPPMLARLPDERLIVIWNNCEMPPRYNGAILYGGRDVLHAAVSEDEGKTWRGFREVYRDPFRNESPPLRGDRGTAYPTPPVMVNGKVLFLTGQGLKRRNIISLDPQWLAETYHEDDFSSGVEDWIVFKAYGPIKKGYGRDRLQGPEVVDHPSRAGARALHIRRLDSKNPDGAVWNFPIGSKGNLALRILLKKGFAGGNIALGDRFFNPCDDNGEKMAMFSVPIKADCHIGVEPKLESSRWYTINLDWDLAKKSCSVLVDGNKAVELKLLNETINGICYLRLRSTADGIDPAGYLIESVAVDIDQPVAPERTIEDVRNLLLKYRQGKGLNP